MITAVFPFLLLPLLYDTQAEVPKCSGHCLLCTLGIVVDSTYGAFLGFGATHPSPIQNPQHQSYLANLMGCTHTKTVTEFAPRTRAMTKYCNAVVVLGPRQRTPEYIKICELQKRLALNLGFQSVNCVSNEKAY